MNTYAVEILQGPELFGAIGMGKAGHFPSASVIIASLNDTWGIWIYDLPAKQERMLSAIQKKNTDG